MSIIVILFAISHIYIKIDHIKILLHFKMIDLYIYYCFLILQSLFSTLYFTSSTGNPAAWAPEIASHHLSFEKPVRYDEIYRNSDLYTLGFLKCGFVKII